MIKILKLKYINNLNLNIMKTTILIFITILFLSEIKAQIFNLPKYKKGKYEISTIYSYSGTLPFTGNGSINFGSKITSNFIKGVKFKLIIDSIGQGSVKKGDTLDLPIVFNLFEGKIVFHIILEGTPSEGGEIYPCNLDFSYILGGDWGMLIDDPNQSSCTVEQSQEIIEQKNNIKIDFYPNPSNDILYIKNSNNLKSLPYNIFDQNGVKVLSGKLTSETTMIDIHQLSTGIYLIKFDEQNSCISKIIKK